MHIKRLLPIASFFIIITGCNTTLHHPDPGIQSTTSSTIASDIDDSSVAVHTPVIDAAIEIKPYEQSRTGSEATPIQTNNETDNYHDIWQRIGAKLTLDRHTQSRSVKDKLAWYARNQDYLDRVADRARPYIYYIVEELQKRNMPMELALLPIVESAYHPFAYSPSKASGIWQFIPSTGKHYGLKQNWWYDGRRDITAATNAALNYLAKLHKEFNGDWLLALAAYNTGEAKVARAIRRNKRAGKKQDFWSLRLPRETRGYVPSLLAVAELVANPDNYQIVWKPIPNEAYFSVVDTGTQLDLALVANLSDLSMDEVYTLNPAYNRWATDPNGPHTLLIPVDKSEEFKKRLSGLPEEERISWKRHVIKRGESLGVIAQKYHTSVNTLRRANGIRSNLIHTGNSLLIPASQQPMKYYTLSQDARRFQGLKKTGVGEKYIYTVQRGDTLWDIGRHYGVSINVLCAWNGISSRSYLRPRQKLTLWLSEDGKALVTGTDVAVRNNNTPSPQGQTYNTDTDTSTYTVKRGDSLWLIAKRNGTTVSHLKSWNNITNNKYLKPGQKLKLGVQENTETISTNNLTATENRLIATISYIVKNGDSLWLIANRYGTTISQIQAWNNLANNKYLKPGQRLNLRLSGIIETNNANSTQGNKSAAINYTVKRGDSLWLISKRFGTTIAQLKRWNNLSNNKYLKPGQKLVLYITEA